MLASHFSMFHVLTDMCSRIVHRLSSFLFISSNERNQTLLNAAIHRTQAVAAARDGGRSALAIELATRAYTLVHRGAHMWQMWPALERVSCSMPAIICVVQVVLGAPSACATGAAV